MKMDYLSHLNKRALKNEICPSTGWKKLLSAIAKTKRDSHCMWPGCRYCPWLAELPV